MMKDFIGHTNTFFFKLHSKAHSVRSIRANSPTYPTANLKLNINILKSHEAMFVVSVIYSLSLYKLNSQSSKLCCSCVLFLHAFNITKTYI